jgi:hypothetical protein
MTKKPRVPPEVRAYLRAIAVRGGQRGGPARAAAVTAQERRDQAVHAINARWAKARKAKAKKTRPA